MVQGKACRITSPYVWVLAGLILVANKPAELGTPKTRGRGFVMTRIHRQLINYPQTTKTPPQAQLSEFDLLVFVSGRKPLKTRAGGVAQTEAREQFSSKPDWLLGSSRYCLQVQDARR